MTGTATNPKTEGHKIKRASCPSQLHISAINHIYASILGFPPIADEKFSIPYYAKGIEKGEAAVLASMSSFAALVQRKRPMSTKPESPAS